MADLLLLEQTGNLLLTDGSNLLLASDTGATLPTAPLKSALGGGVMFARRQLQYIALAGPVFLPAAPVVVPDLSQAFGDVPVRRKFDLRHTQSPEIGRSDPPAPDLASMLPEVPVRPSLPRQGPSLAFAPIPPAFDTAQQAAILTQPPLRPHPISRHALMGPAGVLPPTSPLTPPGVISWQGRGLDSRVWPHRPRQPQLAPAQNVDPITPVAAPDLSWQGSFEIPVRRRFTYPSEGRQPIEPISTPAYLASFWLTYHADPVPARPFWTALQQALAAPPPVIEVLVQTGSWRGTFPDWLRRLVTLVPGEAAVPPNLTVIAAGVPCIEMIDTGATYSTLLSSATTPALLSPDATMSHLADPESC